MDRPTYTIPFIPHRPAFPLGWEKGEWKTIPFLDIAQYRPESSGHRPRNRVKLAYTPEGICGLFQILDKYIRCTRTRFQDAVYKDSCVELFVKPKAESGYFNFEFNCGGAILASCITDPTRTAEGFQDFIRLTPDQGKQIEVFPSMPPVVTPEIEMETLWHLGFFIPFSLFESFVGPLGEAGGQRWYGNFYKCADESSHPHWAAWAPVDALNFHLPQCFGELRFEKTGT